ncbi:hypothetical protein SEA_TRUCKEE_60 [Arthrobacter phage Truckee]|nr:hypothetical protein SEA_TRUCKEE_60 [Arthrobacter phage Truckee]
MSETPNNNVPDNTEEPDPLEYSTQMGLASEEEAVAQAEEMADDEGRIKLPPTPLVQAREVILPVIMRKGTEGDIAVLGDAVYDPETNKMVVSFNTKPGRDIAEFIGSGMLAAVSFQGHMSRSQFNK